MNISDKDKAYEERKLSKINKLLKDMILTLKKDLINDEENIKEFRKFIWNSSSSFDDMELNEVISEDALEAGRIINKEEYFKKLCKIMPSPYFASFIFRDEEDKKYEINISLTYLCNKNFDNILYDWRSPICSLFYDYEVGDCSYEAPDGTINGYLERKRQYKIIDSRLVRVFDNDINVQDDLLQEVLASASSDHMKNIVNTIQKEQNSVIRNIKDKNLIVQGIAGSGKTSVALHRIAFLLYKVKNLKSNNILIFSPNNVFTEYISSVLPELGEENTLQTTFHDYLSENISEFKYVESFIDFIAYFYTYKVTNIPFVTYKQSNEIIKDINDYIDDLTKRVSFTNGFVENKIYNVTKEELNYMINTRYCSIPLFSAIDEISIKLSERNYNGMHKKVSTYKKLIFKNINIPKTYKEIFINFFSSKYSKFKISEKEIKEFLSSNTISYENALLFVYMKGLLEGFKRNYDISQIVIDEAQDYSVLQYLILSKIFRKASFTILGDTNQTINPYYKYDNLYILNKIIPSSYFELNKTYRSSEEIIKFTNKILGLNHVCAIRKKTNKKVKTINSLLPIKETMINNISYLKESYSSVAIITKDDIEASKLYNILKNDINISLINSKTEKFNKQLLIIPAYMAKGLEFDSVIVYNDSENKYKKLEKNLLYVACTRAQHELLIYN
ncbi:MAG: AAA family ATPase [Bacilli bacterium]